MYGVLDITTSTTVYGVKIAMSFSQADSYNANILVPEGEEAGALGENTKQVTLPTSCTGQAVLKWQWCDFDGGCYITCSDIVLDPNAPVANSGNGNSAGVSATIDNGGGDSGGTVVVVLLVIIGLLVVAYFDTNIGQHRIDDNLSQRSEQEEQRLKACGGSRNGYIRC